MFLLAFNDRERTVLDHALREAPLAPIDIETQPADV